MTLQEKYNETAKYIREIAEVFDLNQSSLLTPNSVEHLAILSITIRNKIKELKDKLQIATEALGNLRKQLLHEKKMLEYIKEGGDVSVSEADLNNPMLKICEQALERIKE